MLSIATTPILLPSAQNWEITREFKPQDSSAARSLELSCARRGFASGCLVHDSRAAPKPSPLFPHAFLLFHSRLSAGSGAAKPLSTLPPPPRSKIRPDGCGVCACARRKHRSGEEEAGPWPRLEKARAMGSGGGVGARAKPPPSSQRVPAPALARLSHVRAKNSLQSLFSAREQPL